VFANIAQIGNNNPPPSTPGQSPPPIQLGGEAPAGPPVSSAAPVASSTSLSVAAAGVASVTNGTWTNAPSSFTYQWLRAGAPIFGSNSSTHTLVAADETFNLSCMVTAANAVGYAQATSNAIGPITA
jgi:hypothetical protein